MQLSRKVGIGHQDFEKLRTSHLLYIDKTDFIKEWWENEDSVTLITRPRRFGKTLTMSMLEKFFSAEYSGRGDLFEGLAVWEDESFQKLQGTYPVISLSFANVKEKDYPDTRQKICKLIKNLYDKNDFLLRADLLSESEEHDYQNVTEQMDDVTASMAIHQMSNYLCRYYDKKVIILLDEYDTPMQEAYVNGFWDELASFTRNIFSSTFKTNPYMERAVMTGITRVGKESVFSDLNNLEVVTPTSDKYAASFGFTEGEVYAALDRFGLSDRKQEVKDWYDGFTFGRYKDIYNPWSILNYLDKRSASVYWANTSSNGLISKLLRQGSKDLKNSFEELLRGRPLWMEIDEQIIYGQLEHDERAVWSLLLASGYLRIKKFESYITEFGDWKQEYQLELTNFEVKVMFRNMVRGWFGGISGVYNDLIKALLADDIEAMTDYMNRVTSEMFSYFDTGKGASRGEPERFYHGFVLGLMVELSDRYVLTSNRESGFGRYDVMLEPRKEKDDAVILEFKVFQPRREQSLDDTVRAALDQIRTKDHAASLRTKGIPEERVRRYGFAFRGKEVLIGRG